MSQTPAEEPAPTKKRKSPTGGRQDNDNTRTKRHKPAKETPPAETPPADRSGMRTRSRSGVLQQQDYARMATQAAEKEQLFKKKSTKVKETEVPVHDAGAQPGGDVEMVYDTTTDWVGGLHPVIIKPSAGLPGLGDRPDIVLLLEKGTTQGDLDGDPLYQVLTKIRDSPLCVQLLQDVAGQAPPDWPALVAQQKTIADEEGRAAEPDILELLNQVPGTVCVVVIDSVGFPGLESDVAAGGAKAGYNSTLHFIHHAQNDGGNTNIPLSGGGNYFTYLHDVVFELCNAAQRTNMLAIEAAAAKGTLDCVSYCLAKETQEVASEDRHDTLLASLLKEPVFLSVVDEESQDNQQIALAPPALDKLLYSSLSPDPAERLKHNVRRGHTMEYLKTWKYNYGAAYAGTSTDASAAFQAWTTGKGPAPAIPYVDVVKELTGLDVSDDEILQIQSFVEKTYDMPELFDVNVGDVNESEDSDFEDGAPEAGTKPKKPVKTVKTVKPVKLVTKGKTRAADQSKKKK